MGNEGQGSELRVGDLDALGVPVRVVVGQDAESGAGGSSGDQFDDGAHGGQRPTAPVDGDEAEEAVFDLG